MEEQNKEIVIDESNAIDQASLEPTEETPKWTAKFEGYEDTSVDEAGVEPELESPAATQEQEEVLQETETQVEESTLDEEVLELVSEANTEPLMNSDADVDSDSTPELKVPESARESLPEWVDKIVKFHDETGGDLNDYMKINQNFDDLNEDDVLKQYLQIKNPGFDSQDIKEEFEDLYGVDEDLEQDSREYRKAVRTKKRALAEAKSFFESQKAQYLADLKTGTSRLPDDVKEAVKVAQQVQQEKEARVKWNENFKNQANQVFSDDFKGFTFDTGDGKFRVRINDVDGLKKAHSNVDTFAKEFFDNDGNIKDPMSYHKSIYAAKNADKLARHFYQQGKADALKERAKSTKNIDMDQKINKSDKPVSGTKYTFIPPKFGY